MIVQFIARNNQYNGWLIKDKLYIVLDIYFNFYNKKIEIVVKSEDNHTPCVFDLSDFGMGFMMEILNMKKYFGMFIVSQKNFIQPREITIGGNKGLLYAVKTEYGSYNLRSVASSQSRTGLVWTIDIPESATGTTKNPEIKFLR